MGRKARASAKPRGFKGTPEARRGRGFQLLSAAIASGSFSQAILMIVIALVALFSFRYPLPCRLIVAFLTVLALSSAILKEKKPRLGDRWSALDLYFLMALALVYVVSLLNSAVPRYSLRSFCDQMVYIGLYLAARLALGNREGLRQVSLFCLPLGLLIAGWSLAQSLLKLPIPSYWLEPELRDSIGTRVFASLSNPNPFAGFLLLFIPLGFCGYFLEERKWLRISVLIISVALSIALILSYSRSAWLAAFVEAVMIFTILGAKIKKSVSLRGVPISLRESGSRPAKGGVGTQATKQSPSSEPRLLRFARNDRVELTIFGIALLLVALVFAPKIVPRSLAILHSGSLQHRLFIWQSALAIAQDKPWLGSGIGTFNNVFSAYRPSGVYETFALINPPISAHNDYLQVLAEGGVIWLLLLIAFFATIYLRVFAYWRTEGRKDRTEIEAVTIILFASLIAVQIFALAQSAFYLAIAVLMAITAGGLQSLTNRTNEQMEPTTARIQPLRLYAFPFLILVIFSAVVQVLLQIANAHSENALAYAERDQLNLAEQQLRKASSLDPLDPYPWLLRAKLHQQEQADSEDLAIAERCYRRALKLDETDANAWIGLAELQVRSGKGESAVESYLQATRLDPYHPSGRSALARLYVSLGEPDAALEQLEEANRLYPLLLAIASNRVGKDSEGYQQISDEYEISKELASILKEGAR